MSRFDENSLAQYIDLKMKSAEEDANFIIDRICDRLNEEKLIACEIGSGNGKLLYLLEKRGYLSKGVNYEVSTCRYKFAELMKKRLGIDLVENRNDDILNVKDSNIYNCIIAVDIVTQLITCLYDEAEEEYFKWINAHLCMGGMLF